MGIVAFPTIPVSQCSLLRGSREPAPTLSRFTRDPRPPCRRQPRRPGLWSRVSAAGPATDPQSSGTANRGRAHHAGTADRELGGAAVNALRWMTDPQLFGKTFGGPTWLAGRTLVASIFGLASEMTPEMVALYQQCAGRTALPAQPFREVWITSGRRSG